MTIERIQGWSLQLTVLSGSWLYLILYSEGVRRWTQPVPSLIPTRNPPSSVSLPGYVTSDKSFHLSETPDSPLDNKSRLSWDSEREGSCLGRHGARGGGREAPSVQA